MSVAVPPRLEARTLQAGGLHRTLSLLAWQRDLSCQLRHHDGGRNGKALRVAVCDPGRSVQATALIREDLFSQLTCQGDLAVGLNLSHLLHALSLFTHAPQLGPLTIAYPDDDGGVAVEVQDGGRRHVACHLRSQVCDSPLDLSFAASPEVLSASMRAELLKEIATDLSEIGADAVRVSFSAQSRSVSFEGGGPNTGSVRVDCTLPPAPALATQQPSWLLSLDVKGSGETHVKLDHLMRTIKTDYFRDLGKGQQCSGGHSRDDKVALRVNQAGQVCLLYHIKPFEGSPTMCGVECVIMPLTPEEESFDLPADG